MGKREKTKEKLVFNLYSLVIVVLLFFSHAEPIQALTVDFLDNFGYGTTVYVEDGLGNHVGGYSDDHISFIEHYCPLDAIADDTQLMIIGVQDNNYDVGAYCVNTDRNADSDYDFCIIKNSTWATNCSGVSFPVAPLTALYDGGTNWFRSINLWAYNNMLTDIPICDGEYGNTMVDSVKHVKRADVKYYCKSPANPTCHDCGNTGSSSDNDYYFIDQLRTYCISDGDATFLLQGRYATSSYVSVDNVNCDSYGSGMICDAGYDLTTSTNPYDMPTNPCRLQQGEPCTNSNQCWHDLICGGASTTYYGKCNGVYVNISTNTYINTCDSEAVGSVTANSPTNTCQSAGFISGYACDNALSGVEMSTQSSLYTHFCKAGEGNSCTLTSDCITGLACVGGFCMYDALAIYTTNETDNALYKNSYVSFDPQLSLSSDENIQYSCWNFNTSNDKCYGNSTQCTSECSGATYSGSNWMTIYNKKFSNGGNIPVTLTIGSKTLYTSNYSESFCVSGDGTYCWSCFDALMNDDETSIDWGGNCGTPYFLFCNNKQLNNQTLEISTDYGGYCGNCDNTSIDEDVNLQILLQSNMITYPFNNSLCPQADEITGGIISTLILILIILAVPIFLLILVLIFFSGFSSITFIKLIYDVYQKIKGKNK